MLKRLFVTFSIILVMVVLYFQYQKKNPTLIKIFDSKKIEKMESGSAINLPTDSVKKTINEKIFLQVDEPKNNITVNNPIINISGKTIPNAYIFINEQELKADANGRFESATTLEEGENYILIVVSDDLGNSAEKDILVNLETTQ
ncbi:MAG: hypothetical protein UR56_C0009G0004 [Candidatus Roizmanbacteria bacterium GW2011_GWC2_34_23]|uniref:Bacillopeptidase F n=1 Tax=Candidatus Roizmanbacteria bacterium GW2011_GWC2_34_23 TaxID=1618484 RepID=A0A0G0AWM2_9BACT|nr:MAG: hypothetical protein UR56_C0009G0004 [Candidatus Roizmanbacteria bacterium GW2011_GWC2_34_23]